MPSVWTITVVCNGDHVLTEVYWDYDKAVKRAAELSGKYFFVELEETKIK